jgi:hypothetical protein
MVLADTLRRQGDADAAVDLGEAVVSIAEAKGDVAGSAWIRRRLGELGVARPR